MYPKEYHIQKHEGLEDLGRDGAKKKFGKITAWFTEKKTLTSHPIQGGSFFFLLITTESAAIMFPAAQSIWYKTLP